VRHGKANARPNASNPRLVPQAALGRKVDLAELFVGFLTVGLRGFGGVLPWARRMIVEERGWLDEGEFTSLLGLCQLVPGPNIVNLSVALGGRFRGVAGSIAAFSGLMAAPFVIVLLLGAAAERWGDLPVLARPIGNLGSAAAGLVWAAGVKMALPHRASIRALVVIAAGFAAVALAHWPLVPVVLALVPLSLLLQWRAS